MSAASQRQAEPQQAGLVLDEVGVPPQLHPADAGGGRARVTGSRVQRARRLLTGLLCCCPASQGEPGARLELVVPATSADADDAPAPAAAARQTGQGVGLSARSSSSAGLAVRRSVHTPVMHRPASATQPLDAASAEHSGSRVVSSGGAGTSGAGSGMGPAAGPSAVSRTGSALSGASGLTTLSRPSRWGALATLLSTRLRSFTLLSSVADPGTGALRPETVRELARRASHLDLARACGEVRELEWVGEGAAGLVYRGLADGQRVCVKYTVAHGIDGMSAPATEGLLSRALHHPNIIRTLSWHITRIGPESFLPFADIVAAGAAARGSRQGGPIRAWPGSLRERAQRHQRRQQQQQEQQGQQGQEAAGASGSPPPSPSQLIGNLEPVRPLSYAHGTEPSAGAGEVGVVLQGAVFLRPSAATSEAGGTGPLRFSVSGVPGSVSVTPSKPAGLDRRVSWPDPGSLAGYRTPPLALASSSHGGSVDGIAAAVTQSGSEVAGVRHEDVGRLAAAGRPSAATAPGPQGPWLWANPHAPPSLPAVSSGARAGAAARRSSSSALGAQPPSIPEGLHEADTAGPQTATTFLIDVRQQQQQQQLSQQPLLQQQQQAPSERRSDTEGRDVEEEDSMSAPDQAARAAQLAAALAPLPPPAPPMAALGTSLDALPKLYGPAVARRASMGASSPPSASHVTGSTLLGASGSGGAAVGASGVFAESGSTFHSISHRRRGSTASSTKVSTSSKRNSAGSSNTLSVMVMAASSHALAPSPPPTDQQQHDTTATSSGHGAIWQHGSSSTHVPSVALHRPVKSSTGLASSSGTATAASSLDLFGPIAAYQAPLTDDQLAVGWATMQQILRHLSAKPGDYLTRIVMEEADNGSLGDAVKRGVFRTGGDSGLDALIATALDVSRGMAHLHSFNVIHGDLKPSNVLLKSCPDDPRGFTAKVSDFGLSRIITAGAASVSHAEPRGTVSFLAPEVIAGSSYKASDVWAFGVLLWHMVTGEQPWAGLRQMQIMMGIMEGQLSLEPPPSSYPALAALIRACMVIDHSDRPNFTAVAEALEAMQRDIAEARDRQQQQQQLLLQQQQQQEQPVLSSEILEVEPSLAGSGPTTSPTASYFHLLQSASWCPTDWERASRSTRATPFDNPAAPDSRGVGSTTAALAGLAAGTTSTADGRLVRPPAHSTSGWLDASRQTRTQPEILSGPIPGGGGARALSVVSGIDLLAALYPNRPRRSSLNDMIRQPSGAPVVPAGPQSGTRLHVAGPSGS